MAVYFRGKKPTIAINENSKLTKTENTKLAFAKPKTRFSAFRNHFPNRKNEFSQQTDEIEKWETFQGIREQSLKEQTKTFRN